jgi:hypothetical protein
MSSTYTEVLKRQGKGFVYYVPAAPTLEDVVKQSQSMDPRAYEYSRKYRSFLPPAPTLVDVEKESREQCTHSSVRKIVEPLRWHPAPTLAEVARQSQKVNPFSSGYLILGHEPGKPSALELECRCHTCGTDIRGNRFDGLCLFDACDKKSTPLGMANLRYFCGRGCLQIYVAPEVE